MITHGSTFSGIGAPEVAAEMLGWENVFHCEINPFGRKVLDYYFQNAESYEDITKTDFTKWRNKVTVLTGGFPCQPFSYAGKRGGTEDDRYLWPFMLRCIEQVRPRWFVGENVAGITTMAFPGEDVKVGVHTDLFGACDEVYEKHERYVLDEICESLGRAGYSVQPMLIPACAVGAPHRRDRVFIIAHRMAESIADTYDLRGSECEQGGIQSESEGSRVGQTQSISEPNQPSDTRCEMEGHTTDTLSQRRREIYEKVQSELDDGAEPFGNGRERNVTDTQCEGLQARPDERGNGIENRDTPSWRSRDCSELYPENRWRTFPSVSPVYRGNDGLPFPVDHLTISFGEWKRESLKAYGNAIVPQVMYEIFRIIDIIENGK